MLVYLFKSAACMALLLLFYKVLLENENMHVFKRFYLLIALVASLLIPSIVFIEYVEPAITTYTLNEANNEITLVDAVPQPTDMDVINWSLLVMSIYILGLIGFGFRFFRNLLQIFNRIRKNPKLRQKFSIKVLLQEQLPPHTFFKYIFLNKTKFDTEEIPEEVLLHEEIHAKQRHSFDLVFIELLQAILWFNPMIYFFKKCIKLNHEFLADSAVLKKTTSTSNYQNTLLSYLSQDSFNTYQSNKMANAINYSSIKKRFKIMKTETSKKAVLLRSVLVLPLFALLLYGFSETKIIEKPSEPQNILIEGPLGSISSAKKDQNIITLDISKKGEIKLFGTPVLLATLPSELKEHYTELTLAERKSVLHAQIFAPEDVSLEIVDKVDSILDEYGVATVNIIGPKKLSVIKASEKELKKYNRLAKKYNDVPISKRTIALQELQVLEKIYRKMDPVQKYTSQPFPECLPKNTQESASRKLMAEYNALAKKYNEMERSNLRIQKKDVARLKYIYSLMSDKQKTDSEPFPDFPEPPPAPKAPELNELNEVRPPAPNSKVKKERAIEAPKPSSPKKVNRTTLTSPAPPKPPKPPKPLDHVIEMAKKGATFYYKDKEISSDKAIELLKKNESLNIDSRKSKGKKHKVWISTEPIKIGHTSKKNNILDYALKLKEKNAAFYLDNKTILPEQGIKLIKDKKYYAVETLPWVDKLPEVKIYSTK